MIPEVLWHLYVYISSTHMHTDTHEHTLQRKSRNHLVTKDRIHAWLCSSTANTNIALEAGQETLSLLEGDKLLRGPKDGGQSPVLGLHTFLTQEKVAAGPYSQSPA